MISIEWLLKAACDAVLIVVLSETMAVTDSQNPLLGETTCGSLLQKLQVTSVFVFDRLECVRFVFLSCAEYS